MQHLEVVTRHAIAMGTKEDIVSGFTPALITSGFLKAAFSSQGLSSGVSETVLSLIERDHYAARATNQIILRHGNDVCPAIDSQCLKRLVNVIKGHIGLGKGAFFAVMKFMPEDFAIIQFRQWMRDDGIKGLELSLIESVLNHSLNHDRFHVAHAMCSQMVARGAVAEMQHCLLSAPYETLESAALGKYITKERMLDIFCNRKAFQQAQIAAGDDPALDHILRDSIARHLNLKGASENWVELFAKLTERMDEVVDQQLLVDRHKSAATVVLNKIMNLDSKSISQQINTDRLRIFAYQLGLTEVLGSLKSDASRDTVFAHDLGL
ncbi:hypothetical protein IFT48_05190 [Pseudomonas fluorescens]|uniref:hypothetical protein n=1 Tax=Pseudomonas TaxID=286 RepID=UPI000F022AE6|nr:MULTISPECIES: hypothetical protein [Pseudomonas]MBD8089371.1 hypothetical protein [Pseudomonas fluorescens]MBD8615202.1 hypothetical protein [Pseudomonas putida]MBD8682144.1 hypothetical protein [Pseudomonas sp. CFBP 13719]